MATLNIKNFPGSLYRKLKERARRERRSVAQEVTHLLERALYFAERHVRYIAAVRPLFAAADRGEARLITRRSRCSKFWSSHIGRETPLSQLATSSS